MHRAAPECLQRKEESGSVERLPDEKSFHRDNEALSKSMRQVLLWTEGRRKSAVVPGVACSRDDSRQRQGDHGDSSQHVELRFAAAIDAGRFAIEGCQTPRDASA